jgi:hypothetical protein
VNLTDPRFPAVAHGDGHYESYYLRAVAPDRPAAVWIRYTVHKDPGAAPTGSLWCTLFDATHGAPQAVKQGFPDPRGAHWIEVGGHAFGPGRAAGDAEARGHSGSWDLRFDAGSGALHHLPRDWMYTAPVPRTKTLSPVCDARFSGRVEVDGHAVELDGWRGVVGHNWGAEHAERWIWLHGVDFEGAPDAWVDVAVGRVKAGPLTTPWIANGALHLDGRRRTLGGLGSIRATRVEDAPERARLRIAGVEIALRNPPGQTVGWVYADPPGGDHHSLHSSIAAIDVHVDGRHLHSPHGGCYELGVREHDHGIPVRGCPDGPAEPPSG